MGSGVLSRGQSDPSKERVASLATSSQLTVAEVGDELVGALEINEVLPSYAPVTNEPGLYILLLLASRRFRIHRHRVVRPQRLAGEASRPASWGMGRSGWVTPITGSTTTYRNGGSRSSVLFGGVRPRVGWSTVARSMVGRRWIWSSVAQPPE